MTAESTASQDRETRMVAGPPDYAHLQVFGISHQTAPAEVREALDLTDEKRVQLEADLRRELPEAEALILNTCNRFEVYLADQPEDGAVTRKALESIYARLHPLTEKEVADHSYWRIDAGAVRHLYRVVSGLDSQLVGENEILGQVKVAYQQYQDDGWVGPRLHRCFQKAFQVAKQVRTQTGIGSGQVSIGSVAVDLAERIFGRLKRARVLLIGTGDVGRSTLQALKSRGAQRLTIASRSTERAAAIAEDLKAAILPWDLFSERLVDFDIVLAATRTSEPVVTQDMVAGALRRRPAQPLFLIDLGMPRNIEALGETGPANAFRYELSDLAEVANRNLKQRESAVATCDTHLRERAFRFWADWMQRERRRSWSAQPKA